MSDNNIIRSDHPHEVTMPEGSRIAVSKTAEKTEPSIRKVFQEGEEFIETHMVIEEGGGSQIRTADESIVDPTNQTAHSEFETHSNRIDNQNAEATLTREATSIPVIKDAGEEETPFSEIEPINSVDIPTKNQTSVDTEDMRKVSTNSTAQVEMDFPARVINLKIENDQLHERLDLLEQRNMP
jgi:hypothetical protein